MKGLPKTIALICVVSCVLGGFGCGKEKKKAVEVYHTVSFEENGGKELDDVHVQANAVFSAASYLPIREGYQFDGWFLDAALSQAVNDVTLTGDLTVYAKWLGVYELRFQGDGVELESLSVTEEAPIQAPSAPERENYAFEGWYTDETYEKAFAFGSMPAENVTLYAKWRELLQVRLRFYLNFPYGNGYSVATTNQQEGSSPDLSGIENEFLLDARSFVADMRLGGTADVYRFVGWATDAAGETPFDGVVPYSLTEVKIYAIWERTEDYCRIVFASADDPDVYVVKYLPKGETLDEGALMEIKGVICSSLGVSETEKTGFYTEDGALYEGAPVSEDIRLTLQ